MTKPSPIVAAKEAARDVQEAAIVAFWAEGSRRHPYAASEALKVILDGIETLKALEPSLKAKLKAMGHESA